MVLFILCLLVLILDQLTKYYVVTHMAVGESIPVVEGIFHWTYILNPGAAFGIFQHNRWAFVALAVAVLSAFIIARRYILRESKLFQYGCALFAGGTVGNVIDRVRSGLVIDFFDFRIWPVFNVADIAICVGVGIIMFDTLRSEWLTKKQ